MRLPAFTILTCFCLPSLGEQIYRLPDEYGVPEFSDRAKPGAEIVTLGTATTYPSLADGKPLEEIDADPDAESTAPLAYTLSITSDSEVTRDNAGKLLLQVNIEPELAEGHVAELHKGGKRVQSLAGTGPVQLTNLDRGAHSFSVRVLDGRGKLLAQSAELPVTLLRHSRLHR